MIANGFGECQRQPTGVGPLRGHQEISLTLIGGQPYDRPVSGLRDSSQSVEFVRIVRALFAATRPLQWSKNLLVFLPLFFSVNQAWSLDDFDGAMSLALRAAGAFVIFVGLSASVYLLNDCVDVERDRAHPKKRSRPVASGRLPVGVAITSAAVLTLVGIVAAFLIHPLFGVISLAYVSIQDAYTVRLKRVVLVDVFCVASGFVLRVMAGAAVIEVPVSEWLYICSGLGALFIALSKRKSELSAAGESARRQRDALGGYTLQMLDQLIAVVAASALVTYALYTFIADNLPDNHAMLLTLPFVGFGLLRYMYLVHTRDSGENPEEMLVTDAPLTVAVILWIGVSAAILLVAG